MIEWLKELFYDIKKDVEKTFSAYSTSLYFVTIIILIWSNDKFSTFNITLFGQSVNNYFVLFCKYFTLYVPRIPIAMP